MKGTVAIEWMIMLSMGILILSLIMSMNEDNHSFFRNNVRVSKAKATVNDLADAVDFVYSQGRDARTRVYVTVPAAVNITITTLSSGKGQIQALVYVNGKEEYFDAYTDANLTGSIPWKEGSYCMDVECFGELVNITRSTGSC